MEREIRDYYALQKRFWGVFAPFYDVFEIFSRRIRGRVVALAAAKRGSKILDVATGTGRQAFAFAGKGYDVTGVDLSEAMLAVARKNNRYPNARFEQGDATHMHFPDNSFDVACVSFALHEMPRGIREKALKGIARVTKRGGAIMIIDYALPARGLRRSLFYNFIRLYEGRHYEELVKSDFGAMLGKAGIEPLEEVPMIAGAAKIWKCVNGKK